LAFEGDDLALVLFPFFIIMDCALDTILLLQPCLPLPYAQV
jgi:hypothetical protein